MVYKQTRYAGCRDRQEDTGKYRLPDEHWPTERKCAERKEKKNKKERKSISSNYFQSVNTTTAHVFCSLPHPRVVTVSIS